MTESQVSAAKTCPACSASLREFNGRLVCDQCEGIMMSIADVIGGIHDMTSIEAKLSFAKESAGKRACPQCAQSMKRCEMRIDLEGHVESPHVELDRCDAHGVWFDKDELGAVLATIAGKGFGGGVGRKQVAGDGPADAGGFVANFKVGGRGWAS